MDSQNFVGPIKNKTCFKETGSCIDLILANRKYSFKDTSSYKTGLSDNPHLIYSVMKTTFKCEKPKKLVYRDYSNFFEKDFRSDLFLNIWDGKIITYSLRKTLWKHLISMLRRKPKHFEAIISPTLTKQWEKLLWNVLNLNIKQIKRKNLKIF